MSKIPLFACIYLGVALGNLMSASRLHTLTGSFARVSVACVVVFPPAILSVGCDSAQIHVDDETQVEAPLAVDPDQLDFGLVGATRRFTHKITVTNSGRQKVNIHGFDRSCTCLSVQPESTEFAPRESQDFTLTLNLENIAQFDGQPQDFQVSLKPRIDDGAYKTVWQIRGRVQVNTQITPSIVSLGEKLALGSTGRTAKVDLLSKRPLRDLQVKSSSSAFTINTVQQPSVDSQTHYEIQVLPTSLATSTAGRFEEEIVLQAVSEDDNKPLTPVYVKAWWNVLDEVIVTPELVQLGVLDQEAIGKTQVAIYSPNGRSFEVQEIEQPDNIVITLVSSAPTKLVYEVRQTADCSGNIASPITFSIAVPSEKRELSLSTMIRSFRIANENETALHSIKD